MTELQKCCKKYNFKAIPLNPHAEHVRDKIYWCGYWQTWYQVISIKENKVLCVWEDGTVNWHMTSLDSNKDYELIDMK